jgi:hypothetical protein
MQLRPLENTEIIGKHAASLSLIEIGLGSFLHSFKIPFSGHLLSINQMAILSRSAFKLKSSKSALQISLIASLLKSLSPAGKKLTPMLAISAQGLIYFLGVNILGLNYLGLLVAVIFTSLWAFVQPILFIFLIFGKNFLAVTEYYLHEFEKIIPHVEQYLLVIFLSFVLLKIILAFIVSIFAIKISDQEFEKYQKKILLEIKVKPTQGHSPIYMALRDLLNPLFIISFLLTVFFFLFSESSHSHVQLIWNIMRPLALGFVVFYLFRVYPVSNLSHFLKLKGFSQVSKILDAAIKAVHDNSNL